jgi:hypothetical protein
VKNLYQADVSTPFNNKSLYRALVGCLTYAAVITRPDICVAVNLFSQFQNNPTEMHWKGLKRILRYIKGTLNYCLVYEFDNNPLIGYADSDFASDVNTKKSTSGWLYKVFGATVNWTTRKQRAIALSTTEAEFVALSTAATEGVWLQRLLNELGIKCDTFKMFEDNKSCIQTTQNIGSKRLKHVDVRYNYVKELVNEGKIKVEHIRTEDQIADVLTKCLSGNQFYKLRELLGVLEVV